MSEAPTEVQAVILDGGDVDIPATQVRTFWRDADTDSAVELLDGSVVISSRVEQADAESVRAAVQARITAGESTTVLASHLDTLGFREAVEEWARAGMG